MKSRGLQKNKQRSHTVKPLESMCRRTAGAERACFSSHALEKSTAAGRIVRAGSQWSKTTVDSVAFHCHAIYDDLDFYFLGVILLLRINATHQLQQSNKSDFTLNLKRPALCTTSAVPFHTHTQLGNGSCGSGHGVSASMRSADTDGAFWLHRPLQ